MTARRIHAHVIEPHLLLCSPRLCLEENCLCPTALWARMVFGFRQSRIMHNVCANLRQLIDFMHELVHIDAWIVGNLLVIAIPARVHELTVILVFTRVQHVVAKKAAFT